MRTFIAIVETGSFTKAAEVVHKTQSAVSMQMKRLEERLGKPIFARDGRASKLTEDGDRLLDYARRIIKLNVEALAAFSDKELSGRVRLGLPDDYADRYLPEIMARFSRAYPGVELTVLCQPSVDLVELIDGNELDLAIITDCGSSRASRGFRRERLLWVTSNRHSTHLEEPLPLALGRTTCGWRRAAIECLESPRPAASRRLHQRQCERRGVGGAVGTCHLDLPGIGTAARHAGAEPGRRIPGAAAVPRRPHPQSARELGAGRCARRAHHLVARQPVGSRRRRRREAASATVAHYPASPALVTERAAKQRRLEAVGRLAPLETLVCSSRRSEFSPVRRGASPVPAARSRSASRGGRR